MSKGVLVLSHLWPTTATPFSGPFVRNDVMALAATRRFSVVAPVRWLPPLPVAPFRAERAVPFSYRECGVHIHHPRVLALPFGGMGLEARLWPVQLEGVIRRAAGDVDAGVLHAHFALPDGYAGAQLADKVGLPFVLSVLGSDVLVFCREPRLRRAVVTAMRAADTVIAVSHDLASHVVALGVPEPKVTVIPSGVVTRAVCHDEETRGELGIAPDERVVLWVGRYVPVKRPMLALRAFARLVRSDPSAVLVMVGVGPLRPQVDAEIARLGLGVGRVRQIGWLDGEALWRWQSIASVALNTSYSEGSPVSLMEALCAGTPVAGPHVGGVPAMVAAVDGGVIAGEDSADGLADAVRAVFARDGARDALAKRATAQFGMERTTRDIGRIYDRVMA